VKLRTALFLSLPALALTLGGCEKAEPAPDEKALFQTMEDNASAFGKKDVDAVMATIHPQAPTFASTRDVVSQTFNEVTLKITLSDLKVLRSSPEEAQVSFVQKTEKVDGDRTIPLNILEEIDTLRPDKGKWKIYSTEVRKVTRLDGKPSSSPEAGAPSPAAATAPEPAPKPAAPNATPGASEQKAAAPAEKPGP